MIGKTLSHYRVVEKIGAGGMGEVYLAHDERLERDVALKVLPTGTLADEAARRRFRKEALALSKLNHPNIATVFDFDTQDGTDFLVMELVEGVTLSDKLAVGPLPEKEISRLGMQLAEALEEAHERGVVHRDLKPGNVMVTAKGQAKVLDFGLAKLVRLEVASATAPTESFTETQGVAGTLPYMAPEQLRGEPVDARTDIHALGAVLYEMATGRRPFEAKLATALAADIQTKAPRPPRELNRRVSGELERITLKCLEKEPENRYQSAKEIAVDLRRLGMPSSATAVLAARRPATRRRMVWAAGVALVALLAVLVGLNIAGLRDRLLGRPAPGIGPGGRPAIAVMYFDYSGGTEETRWLSRGVPDMLRTGLAQTPGLDVVSSQRLHEVMRGELEAIGKGQVLDVARRAGAGMVVVGSIFQSGSELRIGVEVQDVGSGRILFAHSVRGEDVFSLADELIEQTRRGLNLAAAPATRPVAEVTTDSLEAYRLYTEGLEAQRNFRRADARQLFQKAVKIDPSFAMAYFRLLRVARAAGDPALGKEYLRKTMEHLDRLPERQKLLVQATLARRVEQNPEKAINLLEDLLARYPDERDAYAELSGIYTHVLNQPEKALAAAERGVKALPNSSLRNDYGYALLRSGNYAKAVPQFEAYARLRPNEANPHDGLAEAYLITGQPEKALERYARALEVDSSFLASHRGRAWAYGMLGRYDEALSELAEAEKILTRTDLLLTPIYFLKAFMLSRVGRYREADEQIRQGIRSAKSLENLRWEVGFELFSALLAFEKGNYRRAVEAVSRAQKNIPQVPDEATRNDMAVTAHLLAGTAEVRAGKLAAARTHLESQRKLYDSSREWEKWKYHCLEGEIALAAGDLAAAEAAFSGGEPELKMWFGNGRPIRSVFANHFPYRDWSAQVKKARGDTAAAIEVYRNLLTPDMTQKWTTVLEPRYVLELARLLAQTGDREAARKEYRRFLDLWKNADPDLPELAQAQSEYAKLQESMASAPTN